MGLLSDFLANAVTLDLTQPRVGAQRSEYRRIENLLAQVGDIDLPAAYAAADQVQSQAAFTPTVSGGTFDQDITLRDGTVISLTNIAYNANAATVQSAINSAASWTDEIVVAGDDLTSGPRTFTYSGDQVDETNHPLITLDGANLTGGGDVGAVTKTTVGQSVRRAWAIFDIIGALTGTVPDQGELPGAVDLSLNTSHLDNPYLIDDVIVRVLAREAAIEDDNIALEASILALFNLS